MAVWNQQGPNIFLRWNWVHFINSELQLKPCDRVQYNEERGDKVENMASGPLLAFVLDELKGTQVGVVLNQFRELRGIVNTQYTEFRFLQITSRITNPWEHLVGHGAEEHQLV